MKQTEMFEDKLGLLVVDGWHIVNISPMGNYYLLRKDKQLKVHYFSTKGERNIITCEI